jgi:hypothetical protein
MKTNHRKAFEHYPEKEHLTGGFHDPMEILIRMKDTQLLIRLIPFNHTKTLVFQMPNFTQKRSNIAGLE